LTTNNLNDASCEILPFSKKADAAQHDLNTGICAVDDTKINYRARTGWHEHYLRACACGRCGVDTHERESTFPIVKFPFADYPLGGPRVINGGSVHSVNALEAVVVAERHVIVGGDR